MIYYYKVFNDKGIFLGYISSLEFRKYQEKNKIMLNATEKDAEYIQLDSNYYSSDALRRGVLEYPKVSFQPISEYEYNNEMK